MNDEARLKAAFAFDEPPARDYAFTAAVMEEVARRRLWISLLMLVPPALTAGVVLWATAPHLEPLAASLLGGLQPAISVLAAAAVLGVFSWKAIKTLRV